METNAVIAIAAAFAASAGVVAGIGIAISTGKAAESVARQPEASSKILSVSLLGLSLAEATAIYAFVVAIILLLLKWS
jgi:F-type H+-transporting ATPase subunit c